MPLALIAFNDLFNHPHQYFKRYALMLAACLAIVSIWPLYNWLATGSPMTNTYTLWWPYDRVGFGEGYGRLAGGHNWERAVQNLNFDFPDLGVTALGWPSIGDVSLAWVVVALGLLWPDHNRRDWALRSAALLIIAHLAYWAAAADGRAITRGCFLGLRRARLTGETVAAPLVQLALPLLLAYSIVFTIEPRLLAGHTYGLQRRHADRIAAAQLGRALVFVRVLAWTDFADLAWQNSPAVADSPVLFALDYGPLGNQALMQAFPDRKVYYYDRTQPIALVAGRQP
jgi:hypothetical protein